MKLKGIDGRPALRAISSVVERAPLLPNLSRAAFAPDNCVLVPGLRALTAPWDRIFAFIGPSDPFLVLY